MVNTVRAKCQAQDNIYSYIDNYFNKRNLVKSKNFKALVTAGPTREYVDPVRYISNSRAGNKVTK